MTRWTATMMAAIALGGIAPGAAADQERIQRSPRILEPSFAQQEPRHFPKHMYLRPGAVPPQRHFPPRIVAVPVIVPVYFEPYPHDGAPQPDGAHSPYWYYCPDSQAYFPDVSVCASGWRAYVAGTSRPAY